ncbi:arginine decarboxylase-like [Punica granatum]|uniref:Arginine decarboxylase n=2 Tax=Punica granatum TaxID=22663 RepID=A0A218WS57_PUNGR|nr:arginine decarboxylase-like [Punica granatum]OWM75463.1 hypothetical protein CDL15_Pgr021627 [Punica granatum]PKI35569.1 hypothetical protein CRG98_044023 [Punica granatum]
MADLNRDNNRKLATNIGGESSLPLHELDRNKNRCYYSGHFLGGAYEEPQGGLNNLFGGPNIVRVERRVDDPSRFTLPIPTYGDLLRTMRHEAKFMVEAFKRHREEPAWTGATKIEIL